MTTSEKQLKDSGVEWIGKIPKEWSVDKAKTFIKKQQSGVWGEEARGDESDLPCLRVADFNYEKLSHYPVETIRSIPPSQRHRILKKDSILIERSGGGEKQPVGRAVLFEMDQKMVCANFIDALETRSDVVPKFFAYELFAAYAAGLNTKAIKQSTGIQNLDTKSYFQEPFPHPSFSEQQKITEFLDSKTSLIDRAIEQKRRLVELLKEKRTAVIHKAVTRGLDENAELMDSGVDWIGKIPRGWRVYKIKHICSIQSGDGFPDDLQGQETTEIPFYKVSDVNGDGKFVTESANYVSKLVVETKRWHLVKSGSILMAKIGAALAKNHRKVTQRDCCIDNNMLAVSANERIITPAYGYWFWKIIDMADFQNISSVPSVNMGWLKEHQAQIPSKDQQDQIATFLDSQIPLFDRMIGQVEKTIDLLMEYRESLISNVVTGKITV